MGERKNETLGANLVVVMRMSRCDTGDLPAKFLLDSGVIGLSGGEIARRDVLAKLLKFRLDIVGSSKKRTRGFRKKAACPYFFDCNISQPRKSALATGKHIEGGGKRCATGLGQGK